MKQGDYLANLMYVYWVKHGIEPSKIYKMSIGERLLIRAFYAIESENK